MLRRIAIVIVVGLIVSACSSSPEAGSTPYIEGRTVYGSVCSTCHGNAGQGGVGPNLSSVLETFPTCEEHMRWITLGSKRWTEDVGPTYGATDKPVKGAMPELGLQLSEDEIAAAAVYERSRFGDIEPEVAAADCGVPEAASTEP